MLDMISLFAFVSLLQAVSICAFTIPSSLQVLRRTIPLAAKDLDDAFPVTDELSAEDDIRESNGAPSLGELNITALLNDNLINEALQSNVSYFYLQNELGLSEESMWKITIDAPSALGMTAATIRAKVEVLRKAMNLSPEDVRAILSRQPTLLHLSAKENLAPKLAWIKSSLKMNEMELRQLILAQPSILTYAPANLENKFKFFTTVNGLGFTVTECRALLLQEAKLWTSSVKTGLLPRAKFFLHELEIPKNKLRVIIQKNPRVLLYSLEENLAPKLINYCIMTLHMDPSTHLTKLLTTYPQVLDINAERRILPITRYFLTELEFSAHEFRSILLKCPRVLTSSLQKIKHNVGYLRYGLELDAAGVKRVLYQAPQVLGLNEKTNLEPTIKFLQEQLLGENNAEGDEDARMLIRRVILGLPTVLYLSVEKNLKPKMKYLRSMLESEAKSYSEENYEESLQQLLCETVSKRPALLGYSLEKRIKPRLEKIVNAGLLPSSIAVGISMTEKKFEFWLQGRQKKKAAMAVVLQKQSPYVSAAQNEDKSSEESDRSGRVVHWRRERKPI